MAAKVRERRNNNGVVHFEVDYRIEGRRKREYFKTKPQAKLRVEQIAILKRNQGTAAFSLPEAVRVMASRCVESLKVHGRTLDDATKFYLAHPHANERSTTVEEPRVEFLQIKAMDAHRGRYLGDLRAKLAQFGKDFGARK